MYLVSNDRLRGMLRRRGETLPRMAAYLGVLWFVAALAWGSDTGVFCLGNLFR